jgi:hypothetical protein
MSSRFSGVKRRHFVIAGAQRAGTTFLYHLLDQHPQIEMARPLRPEPKFFLSADLYRQGLDAYHRLFFRLSPEVTVLGEKSTSYMEHAAVASRIHDLLPDAKLLFLLRDPVERAISNYWFSLAHGVERASLEEALSREAEKDAEYDAERYSVSPFAYLRRGLYLELLKPFLQRFLPTNIMILVFEKLICGELDVGKVFRFLEVNSEFRPRSSEPMRNAAPRRGGGPSPLLRRRLVEYFAEPNHALALRCDLDLSCWQSGVQPTAVSRLVADV